MIAVLLAAALAIVLTAASRLWLVVLAGWLLFGAVELKFILGAFRV